MASRSRSDRYDRFFAEKHESIRRSEAERDRDRILYSSAFRRLGGVTQVAAAGETALLHNRLTHSLKVGQVARKLGATLNYLAGNSAKVSEACFKYSLNGGGSGDRPIDPWVLETAGMAHDLGHPPFGHIGEAALQKVLSSEPNDNELVKVGDGFHLHDSFEGNAQTFRIITKLAFGRIASEADVAATGLNLTRASLAAILKYPWQRRDRPAGVDAIKEKWSSYDSEQELLAWATKGANGRKLAGRERPDGQKEYRTIEAQAMDWADDITYGVHDVEDFCRAGLLPLNELRAPKSALAESFWTYCEPKLRANSLIEAKLQERPNTNLEELFYGFISQLPPSNQSTRSERELFRTWSSQRIDAFTGPSDIAVHPSTGFIDITLNTLLEVEILKKLTWFFIIDRPALGSAQKGQGRVIRELFIWLSEWVSQDYDGAESLLDEPRTVYTLGGLPPRLIDYVDVAHRQEASDHGYRSGKEKISRAVADYISSLTERQVLDLHNRIGGSTTSSMLEGWFQV